MAKEISQFCKDYLKAKDHFEWFIIKYFGKKRFLDLWNLADEGQENDLRSELEDIWFKLPSNRFNIIENPQGWSEFINLIDN